MKELTQVRDAVTTALAAAGLPALAAFPDQRAERYPGAVAAVSVGAAEGRAVGFCDYLGEVYDEAAGIWREVYGKQLEGDISLEIRAGRAADCETGCETASAVLLSGLPSGIRPGELRWEAIAWEKSTGMFLRRGALRCQAVFTAQTGEDGETFLDFILKGVIRN
ncbi:hypothetical protein [uncultured Dysosmobacter sp.]|uniref:hypothetical protein n=1 Tax=uncultured Dysosmobacter sp. TaxID=2591384 RepID=UPI00263894C0|nr:hypothetical protein [uncultured Dysosmobacter sp.]